MSMREIKFRAYDKKKKKWLVGYDVGNLGGFSLFGEVMLLGEWSHILDTYLMSRDDHDHEDLVVMQYTGLKDKNGKEIYEGDLLGIQHKNDYEIAAVHWGEAEWLAGVLALNANLFMDGKAHCDLEIIGNIYENPDLLNKPTNE